MTGERVALASTIVASILVGILGYFVVREDGVLDKESAEEISSVLSSLQAEVDRLKKELISTQNELAEKTGANAELRSELLESEAELKAFREAAAKDQSSEFIGRVLSVLNHRGEHLTRREIFEASRLSDDISIRDMRKLEEMKDLFFRYDLDEDKRLSSSEIDSLIWSE